MHGLGLMENSSFANKTIYIPMLKLDKTTFTENFVNNPKFANTDKVKNKLKFAEHQPGDILRLSLLNAKYLPELDDNMIPDRYHPEEAGKVLGVQNWRTKL